MNLALYDFDGTIIKRDSFIEFVKYLHGVPKLILGFLIFFPWILGMKIGLISKQKIKEKLFIYFFNGISEDNFIQIARRFSLIILPKYINKDALDSILTHKKSGNRVIVVTASVEEWIAPWCEMMNIEWITTKLEKKNKIITGRIEGLNCNGIEKVYRIKNMIRIDDYDIIYAYGDSIGDLPMMDLADYRYFRRFK